jgi:hypothetical protein
MRNWKDYAIVAHALKSTSLGIGASGLSDLSKKMEFAAKAEDVITISEHHEELLMLLAKVLEEIGVPEETVADEESARDEAEPVELSVYVNKLKQLLDYVNNYEMVMALECMEQLRKFMHVEGIETEEILQQVESAVNDFDYEEADVLLTKLIEECEEKKHEKDSVSD